MSMDIKFYTKAEMGSFANIKDILEKVLEIPVTVNVNGEPSEYARFFFTYKEEGRMLWVFLNNPDFDKNVLHTRFDLSCWGNAKEIMLKIAPYFGGWFIENDSNDEAIYVEKAKDISSEQTNAQKLYGAVAKKFGYTATEALVKFIQENEQLIKELNFGNALTYGYCCWDTIDKEGV